MTGLGPLSGAAEPRCRHKSRPNGAQGVSSGLPSAWRGVSGPPSPSAGALHLWGDVSLGLCVECGSRPGDALTLCWNELLQDRSADCVT